MKIRSTVLLPLAAAELPAMAQQAPFDSQQPAASSESSSKPAHSAQNSQSTSTQDVNSDQNMSAHQPLQPETPPGFWGKLNPFARKKYVQRQLSPIRNRVNELDDLTAANAKADQGR